MDLMICGTCGVQYESRNMKSCKICDDPRQFVSPEGQWWTTLRDLQKSGKYHNEFHMAKNHSGLVSIVTVPQVGLGQRAILCCTAKGNILWDCITYIDEETVNYINELGGIQAIAISHPHYYSTAVQWAETFICPVYYSAEDEDWITRSAPTVQRLTAGQEPIKHGGARQIVWSGSEIDILSGEVKIVKAGGHFPGSTVMLWKEAKKLMVADTIQVVPSGVYHVDRLPGTTSFAFMWSYPNFIPLPPDDVHRIWKAVAALDFEDTHGGFMGRDSIGDSKRRVLQSAKIYVKAMGFDNHAILREITDEVVVGRVEGRL